jgi:predicted nuclease with TOPRIM domain
MKRITLKELDFIASNLAAEVKRHRESAKLMHAALEDSISAIHQLHKEVSELEEANKALRKKVWDLEHREAN